ncbi:hypothetical protein V3C99_016680, partial [Haemonchus contortus]
VFGCFSSGCPPSKCRHSWHPRATTGVRRADGAQYEF